MLNTVRTDSFDLDQLFTHDEIDSLATNEVSVKAGNDLSDRKSTRLNSSHSGESRMPSSA